VVAISRYDWSSWIGTGGRHHPVRARVDGKALWYDKTFHTHAPYASQDVVDRFHAAGLKGAVFTPFYDRPWPGADQ
jgi:hypothetical protein